MVEKTNLLFSIHHSTPTQKAGHAYNLVHLPQENGTIFKQYSNRPMTKPGFFSLFHVITDAQYIFEQWQSISSANARNVHWRGETKGH
jgi:hypothetical protein